MSIYSCSEDTNFKAIWYFLRSIGNFLRPFGKFYGQLVDKFYGHFLVNFMAIWLIMWSFGIFFPIMVWYTKKNLETYYIQHTYGTAFCLKNLPLAT
jgi:hypothetical protein